MNRGKQMGRLWKKLAALLLAGVLTGCSAPAEEMQQPVERSLFAMNTYMTFTAYGEDAQAALQEAEECIQQVEGLWSVTDKDSEIYQANHSGGQPVTVSEETAEIISFALEMAQRTGGALDPTIYPVLTAWGFTTDSKQVPSQQQIAQLLEQVGYDRIQLNGSELTVPDGMELDLGAVGKGYAVEQTARAAQARGLTSALLNIGGNVRAIGTKPGGKPWTAGVENPWGDDPAYIQAVELADGDSLVISGDYQRYFEYDGVRYAHLIDLTTGYPARYVSSVAVLARADTGGLADALSTGLFCLPEETGQALAAQNHYAVLWMRPDETTSQSADWPQ